MEQRRLGKAGMVVSAVGLGTNNFGGRADEGASLRVMDNVFVERLWRSIKYEEVYLKAYQNGTEARKGIGAYLAFYNQERPHQALGYRSPGQVFHAVSPQRCLLEHPQALPSDEGLRDTPAVDSLILASPLS